MTDRESRDDPDCRDGYPLINLGADIANLFNVLDKSMAQKVAPHGITGIEYSLLWYCLEGEWTATRLAQVLPVDAARISRIVTELVDKGLLSRRRLRSDRRIVMLRLTEEGRELASHISQEMQRYYVILTEGIGEEEIRVFEDFISKIIANHAAAQSSE